MKAIGQADMSGLLGCDKVGGWASWGGELRAGAGEPAGGQS